MTYLDWLKNEVEYFDGERHDFLLDILYLIPYIPVIDRDANRAADGVKLRDEYFGEYGIDENVIDSPCSFLEFMIALARRMNYIYARSYEDRTKNMFWTMVYNAELDRVEDEDYIRDRVDVIINRTYFSSGYGGLFPLKDPSENQKNVEVWYQMNQYLYELMKEEGRL